MTKVTVGQLLDLIDSRRESEELVCIMDGNGKARCKAMVCSEIWDGIEGRTVDSIQAEGDALRIWLDDKYRPIYQADESRKYHARHARQDRQQAKSVSKGHIRDKDLHRV